MLTDTHVNLSGQALKVHLGDGRVLTLLMILYM